MKKIFWLVLLIITNFCFGEATHYITIFNNFYKYNGSKQVGARVYLKKTSAKCFEHVRYREYDGGSWIDWHDNDEHSIGFDNKLEIEGVDDNNMFSSCSNKPKSIWFDYRTDNSDDFKYHGDPFSSSWIEFVHGSGSGWHNKVSGEEDFISKAMCEDKYEHWFNCLNNNDVNASQSKTHTEITLENTASRTSPKAYERIINLTNGYVSFSPLTTNDNMCGMSTTSLSGIYPGDTSQDFWLQSKASYKYGLISKCGFMSKMSGAVSNNIGLYHDFRYGGTDYAQFYDSIKAPNETDLDDTYLKDEKHIYTCMTPDPKNSTGAKVYHTTDIKKCFVGCRVAAESNNVVSYKYYHPNKSHHVQSLTAYGN